MSETNPTQAIPTDTSRAWRDVLLLAVLLAVFFGFELGGRALWHPDEGRYSEIPRAMVASGDYVTPRLNGVKYFEKPALFYWMQAGSIKLFGVNEWALRLWPALLALAGCLAVYGAGRKLFGRRAGLIAAIVLATSPLYYLLARIITLDMAVSVLLTGALLSFLLGVREPPGRTRSLYLYAFYALCAAATLTKGLIGIVIPAMVIGAWIVLLWDWRLLRAIHLPTGLLLFFVLAAPWHVLAARANPEFAQFYFIHEHFERYLTTTHGRYQPWWFFLPVLVFGMLPWIGLLFPALRDAWAGWRARRERREELFLLLWVGLVFAFFSVSGSKLIPYILPMLPPSALLLGRYLAPAEPAPEPKGLRSGFWLFLVATAALGAYLAMELSRRPQAQADVLRLGSGAYLMLAGLLLVALAHFFLGRLATVTRPLAVLAAGAALLVLALGAALPVLDDKYSVKALALELKARLLPADEVITLRAYYQDLPVYLARRITVVDWKGELEFGASQQDVSGWMIGEAEFHRRWQSPNTVYMITERKNLDWLRAQGLPHRILKATGDNVLLSNRGPAP
jgi:4-amino-4-deoxy-L-arabinose transferase-like glycosyltransferase